MAQQIRELMTPNPVALPGTASVHEAARAMRDAQIGDVIVIENNAVCGIVTDRDLVVRILAEPKDPATTTLADICSHSLVTVTPTDSVEEAVRLMRTHAIRRLPVVDGGQAVPGCQRASERSTQPLVARRTERPRGVRRPPRDVGPTARNLRSHVMCAIWGSRSHRRNISGPSR
jgi:CBS domain-containing protein